MARQRLGLRWLAENVADTAFAMSSLKAASRSACRRTPRWPGLFFASPRFRAFAL